MAQVKAKVNITDEDGILLEQFEVVAPEDSSEETVNGLANRVVRFLESSFEVVEE